MRTRADERARAIRAAARDSRIARARIDGTESELPAALADVRPRATAENLARVRALYREDETGSLWGIPYVPRPGQSPRDIDRGWRGDWFWLGQPGWYGEMTREEIEAAKAFLLEYRDEIPRDCHDWCILTTKS